MYELAGKDAVQVASDFTEGKASLLEIVESLGPYLSSTEPDQRIQGTKMLSSIMSSCHGFVMKDEDVDVIVAFFCDRLRDYPCVEAVIPGLTALMALQPGAKIHAEKTMRAILTEVTVQAATQSIRLLVFQLIQMLLSECLENMKLMGADFVFGFIQAMDGEKDPRCLVTVFKLIPTVTKNFPITRFAEEFFEVFSCYFPVTFKPPADDDIGITTEDLSGGLRDAMASSAEFAPFCLELLLEKLDSDVTDTKTECFETLALCAPEYGKNGIQPSLEQLYRSIREHVFENQQGDLRVKALDALTSIVRSLAADSDTSFLNEFLAPIIEEISRHMADTNMAALQLYCDLGVAISRSAALPCSIVLNSLVEPTIKGYDENTEIEARIALLGALVSFVQAGCDVTPSGRDSALVAVRDRFITVFVSAKGMEGIELLALTGLVGLARSGVMTTPQLVEFARMCSDALLTAESAKVRRENAVAIGFLGGRVPAIITNQVVPYLKQALSNPVASQQMSSNDVLKSIADISTTEAVAATTLPIMLSWCKEIVKSSSSLVDAKVGLIGAAQCVAHTCSIIQPGELQNDIVNAVLPGISACISGDVAPHVKSKEDLDVGEDVVDTLVTAAGILFQRLGAEEQKSLGATLVPGVDVLQQYISDDVSSGKLLVVIFYCGIIGAFRKNALPAYVDVQPIVQCLTRLGLQNGCPITVTTNAAAASYSILNKIPAGAELDHEILALKTHLESAIASGDANVQIRAVKMYTWLTKAIVLRSHPVAVQMSQLLLELLANQAVSSEIADAIYIIMSDSKRVLSKQSHATVRLMYKQRFFLENIPKLVEGYHKSSEELRHNYLTTCSRMLACIPKQVLYSELPPLIPLLLQTLEMEEPTLLTSTLNTLYMLIFDTPEIISTHIDALLPLLLTLVKHAKMVVRRAALQALGAMASLPPHLLYPHAKHVVWSLVSTLDDPKRFVRTDAVKCRSEWMMLSK